MKEAIRAMRSVFTEHEMGRTKSYPRVHIPFDEHGGSIGYMEAGVDSLGVSVSKIASLYHNNPSVGLPRVNALITLNRIDTGVPIAIMDGNYLTMLRTGAVAALAADYLSAKSSRSVGIIGAGVQGRGQLRGLMEVRKIERVYVYDINKSASERFAEEAREKSRVTAEVAEAVTDLKGCDIIAAATPSKVPLITKDILHSGLHINSVGIGAGLGKQEIDFSILRDLKLVVDDRDVARTDSLGDAFQTRMISEPDIYASLGELVTGRKQGREGDGEISIFISSGIPIQDAAVAKLAYEAGVSRGLGRTLSFF